MGTSSKRQQVVLAEAHHVDVPDQHQLIVVGLERGDEHLCRVDPEPGEQLGVGPGDPGRGLLEPVTVWIFTDGDQDLPDRFLHSGKVDAVLDGTAGEPTADQPGGDVVQVAVRLGGRGGQPPLGVGRRLVVAVQCGPSELFEGAPLTDAPSASACALSASFSAGVRTGGSVEG